MTEALRVLANAVRGFLIGCAELVPGVSGGTIALVTGVYDSLIDSASHVVSALVRLVRGPDRLAGSMVELRRTRWSLVVPVLVGMVAALLTVAALMEGFVTGHPEHARGLFFGFVVVSLVVPLRMASAVSRSWSLRDGAVLLGGAVVAFVLVGIAGGREITEPPLLLVTAVAAVAICALVLPGVSGSFLLLAVGLYSTTLGAVSDRDLAYLGAFGLGAFLGLASFVQVLRWALDRHRRTTLLAMAGLMVGSLRALWPWQDGAGDHAAGAATAPYDPVAGPLLLALLGAVVVGVTVWLEARITGQVGSAAETAQDEARATGPR